MVCIITECTRMGKSKHFSWTHNGDRLEIWVYGTFSPAPSHLFIAMHNKIPPLLKDASPSIFRIPLTPLVNDAIDRWPILSWSTKAFVMLFKACPMSGPNVEIVYLLDIVLEVLNRNTQCFKFVYLHKVCEFWLKNTYFATFWHYQKEQFQG